MAEATFHGVLSVRDPGFGPVFTHGWTGLHLQSTGSALRKAAFPVPVASVRAFPCPHISQTLGEERVLPGPCGIPGLGASRTGRTVREYLEGQTVIPVADGMPESSCALVRHEHIYRESLPFRPDLRPQDNDRPSAKALTTPGVNDTLQGAGLPLGRIERLERIEQLAANGSGGAFGLPAPPGTRSESLAPRGSGPPILPRENPCRASALPGGTSRSGW